MNHLIVLLGLETWKPILSSLLFSPLPFIVLTLLGARLILPRRGLGWLLVLSGTALLWLCSSSSVAGALQKMVLKTPPALTAARVAQLRAEVQKKQPTAIVVLGGGIQTYAPEYGVANLKHFSLERLRYGIWLSRETGAPVMYSGGIGWGVNPDGSSEAQAAAQVAQEFGRPLKWQEDKSRDTRENALYALQMLKAAGVTHVLLVTHGFHMARAVRNFEEAAGGMVRIEPAPMGLAKGSGAAWLGWFPSADGVMQMNLVVHEVVGLLGGA